MDDKRPLTPFAKQCYEMFMQGLNAYQIQKRTHRDMDSITNARAEIFNKGYELPELATPRSELPDNIEMTREVMKAMNEKEKRRILTDEERQQIIEYRKEHTVEQTMKKFHRTGKTIANVCKAAKQAENPAPEVPESEPAAPTTPKIVVNAVRAKLEEVEKCISLSEQILANATADRAALVAWLEVHDAEL